METSKKACRLAEAGSSTPHAARAPRPPRWPACGVRAGAGGGAERTAHVCCRFLPLPDPGLSTGYLCLALLPLHATCGGGTLSRGSQCRSLFCVGFGACLCSCTYVGCPPHVEKRFKKYKEPFTVHRYR